jgi:N4-gp56 family major capsid protein
MSGSTYGDISQRTAAWAATEMLEHARPIIVLSDYGQSKPLPKNKAEQVKFRRPVPYVVSTTQLTEGVTPSSHKTSYVDVPATMGQYGDLAEITDRVADMSEDPVLKDMSVLSGEQAAETIEMVTWGVIKAGTNVVYSTAADTVRTDVDAAINLDQQRTAVRFLNAQRGKRITSKMSSSVQYGTEAVDAAYLCFGHTDCEQDIRDMTGFTPTEKYGSMKPLPYECGKVENVRYILTPLLESFADSGAAVGSTGLKTSGTLVDVYPLVMIAKEAYGLVPLRGAGAIHPTVLNPGTVSKSDPLGQRGYVGWKTWFVAVVLNQAWMVRLEAGVSALNGVS